MALSRQPLPREFHEAFQRLRDSVTSDDARTFQNTRLEDVWSAARHMERQLEERGSLRAFERIEPFLSGLDQYSRAIEIACNGTPFLPWIWAPIKLLLQIALNYHSAMEKLTEAYASIAAVMPRFDKLSSAFNDDHSLQQLLGWFYADILEFHRRAYKVFRKRAWHIVFDSLWRPFDSRFRVILARIEKHQAWIEKQANVTHIVDSKEFHRQQLQQMREWQEKQEASARLQERQQEKHNIRESVAWIDASEEQENTLETLLGHATEDSPWIIQDAATQQWLRSGGESMTLWIQGKPGIGKSVLAAQLIDHLETVSRNCLGSDRCDTSNGSAILYFFCNRDMASRKPLNAMLRYFTSQIILKKPELASYLLDNFVNAGHLPSNRNLKSFLDTTIPTLDACFMLIDGLDEYEPADQAEIIETIRKIQKTTPSTKLLLSSRKLPLLQKHLRSCILLDLEKRHNHIHKSIIDYVDRRLKNLRWDFEPTVLKQVEGDILEKANNMFLWVKLVLSAVELLHSPHELKEAIKSFPKELDALYTRIIDQVCGDGNFPHQQKAIRILQWLTVVQRPVRRSEIESGIVFAGSIAQITNETRYRGNPLELCGPLLEIDEGGYGMVRLVHFTAMEYLRMRSPPPIFRHGPANEAVARACLIYLYHGLSLGTSDSDVSEVLHGYHDLCLYACDYWYHHLLEILRLRKGALEVTNSITEIGNAINRLANHTQMVNLLEHTNTSLYDSEVASDECWLNIPNGSLELLQIDEHSNELIRKGHVDHVTHLKSIAKSQEKTTSSGALGDSVDEALFSTLKSRYHEIVEKILTTGDGSGEFDLAALVLFRKRLGDDPYKCRYPQCPRGSHGFQSADTRDVHETLHTAEYECKEQACPFFGMPFKGRAALLRHHKKYHIIRTDTRPNRDRAEIKAPIPTIDLKPGSGIFLNEQSPTDLSWANTDFLTIPKEDWPSHVRPVNRLNNEGKDEKEFVTVLNPKIGNRLGVTLVSEYRTYRQLHDICFNADGAKCAAVAGQRVLIYTCIGSAYCYMSTIDFHDNESSDYHPSDFRTVHFSPDDRYLVNGGGQRSIKVWDFRTQQFLQPLADHGRIISSIDLHPQSVYMISGNEKGTDLWSFPSGKLLKTYLEAGEPVAAVAFSPSGAYFASYCFSGNVLVFETDSQLTAPIFTSGRSTQPILNITSCGVTFMAENEVLASSGERTVNLLDPLQGVKLGEFGGHSDIIWEVRADPGWDFWLTSSADGSVNVRDADTFDIMLRLWGSGSGRQKVSVDACPSRKTFVTACGDGCIRFWSGLYDTSDDHEWAGDRFSRATILRMLQEQVPPSGWQQAANIELRLESVMQLISHLKSVKQDLSDQSAQSISMLFEAKVFDKSPNQMAYVQEIQDKLREISVVIGKQTQRAESVSVDLTALIGHEIKTNDVLTRPTPQSSTELEEPQAEYDTRIGPHGRTGKDSLGLQDSDLGVNSQALQQNQQAAQKEGPLRRDLFGSADPTKKARLIQIRDEVARQPLRQYNGTSIDAITKDRMKAMLRDNAPMLRRTENIPLTLFCHVDDNERLARKLITAIREILSQYESNFTVVKKDLSIGLSDLEEGIKIIKYAFFRVQNEIKRLQELESRGHME